MRKDIHINQLRTDESRSLIATDKDVDWVKDLLEEINEESDSDRLENPEISFEGEVLKKRDIAYGDLVLLDARLTAKFHTACVKTGKPLVDEMEINIHAIFLDEDLKEKFGEDEVDFYYEEEERDLFYLDNQNIDMKEILHEYLFLNKNPYPTL